MRDHHRENLASQECRPQGHQRIRRCSRLIRRAIAIAFSIYLLFVLTGLIPVNRNFQHSATGVQVFLHPSGLHTDIIVPITNDVIDWRNYFSPTDFTAYDEASDHLAFGWGDRRFFLETPEWSDLRPYNVASSLLWPTASAMRVQLRSQAALPEGCIRVLLSDRAYADLCRFLLESIKVDHRQRWVHIAQSGYGATDTFYEGCGQYHLFNTCNTWAGGAMKQAGLPVGWYLTWPGTTTLYLGADEVAN
jgi:uncharacterized protein (TIGR02117 family)